MRKIDFLVLMVGLVGALAWVIISGRDGFKANSAVIVARSISVVSTIDGQIDNDPPVAGERVRTDRLLVRIRNGRIDRSKLTEYESTIAFLSAEIENIKTQQVYLKSQLERFQSRAKTFSSWLVKDLDAKSAEDAAALEIAKNREGLLNGEVARATQLHQKNLTSDQNIETAKIEAKIASKEVLISETQLRRNEILRDALKHDGVFFESGDASYWDKMIDTLEFRIFDNESKIATLKLQLSQAKLQSAVENERIESSFAEEHRAPFNGIINATFVTRGTRVTAGTNLYQILNCTRPIIIIPIPDNRVSEFSVGLRVTVYPTDTDQELSGTISYVTSGALIGADTSIQVQQDLTIRGNRAIVELDSQDVLPETTRSCEAERKAVVVIHTKSWFDRVTSWGESSLDKLSARSQ